MPTILTEKEKIKTENRLVYETIKWYSLACSKFNLSEKDINIVFNKTGNVAGTAQSSTNTINYNVILAYENQDKFYNRTVPHEVMHLIAYRLYGENQGHNKNWKNLMRHFGLDAGRCHDYDTTNARVKKHARFIYRCECGKICHVGKTVHKKIQNGQVRYHCRGKSISFQSVQ